MLAATHIVTGAAVGLGARGPGRAVLRALASHVALDFIGHDDHTVTPVQQAALGAAALAVVVAGFGLRSRAVLCALAGAVPDTEIISSLVLRGHLDGPFLFPSHWQVGPRRGSHPVRLPGPGVSIAVELAATTALAAALVVHGRRPR